DIREIAGPSVRDAAWNEQKERREDDVHGEIKGKEGRKELRPSERNGEAIGITQVDARNALLLEFVGAERNARRLLAGRAHDGKARKRPVPPPPIRLLPIDAPPPLHFEARRSSGNPSGRPCRHIGDLSREARRYSHLAVSTLVRICREGMERTSSPV